MMEQIGYSIVDEKGTEVKFWGDISGQCAGIPDYIDWPSGDRTYCPSVGMDNNGAKFVLRYFDVGLTEGIAFVTDKVVVTRLPLAPIVPASITDRQFFQQLAIQGIISENDALAANAAVIPPPLLALVNQLPVDQQFSAKMIIGGSVTYYRADTLTNTIGAAYGWTPEQLDAFFVEAEKL